MSLFASTILTSGCLLILGAILFWNVSSVSSVAKRLPRSRRFTILAFGVGSVWFLYQVSQLSESDFGNWRVHLMFLFGAIAVLSYFYVPDFLAVRGVCVCLLLGSAEMLQSAFSLYDVPGRLFLVSFAYVLIALSIYLAVAPYRVRDFLDWLFQTPGRPKFVGGVVFVYGLVLSVAAFTY